MARTPEAAQLPRLDLADRQRSRAGRGLSLPTLALLGLSAAWIGLAAARLTTGDPDAFGPVLVPVAGFAIVAALAQAAQRRHPEEPYLRRWLLIGCVVKLVASVARWAVLTYGYDSGGDATRYSQEGAALARSYLFGDPAPHIVGSDATAFVSRFTGWVYTILGPHMLVGFMVFGLLAFLGTYCWYRAITTAIPFVHRRAYLIALMIVPSVVFWPSSIGKESLMQLGLGVMALGTAHVLTRRLVLGSALLALAGWLVYTVRPHLVAIAMASLAIAYVLGRRERLGYQPFAFLLRGIGYAVVVAITIVALQSAAAFLQIEDFSSSTLETRLEEQTERTQQGGSSFDPGDSSLSPLRLPVGFVMVAFRPFPFEADSSLMLLASFEGMVLAGLFVARWRAVAASLRNVRSHPFLLYCWGLLAAYSFAFSSFANFGLLARQRSLVIPALLAVIAVDPAAAARARKRAGHGTAAAALPSPLATASAEPGPGW